MAGSNGDVRYSAFVKLALRGVEEVLVYPNPVSETHLFLMLGNKPAGTYKLSLYSASGQLLLRKVIAFAGGSTTESIPIGNGFASGKYQLLIEQPDGKREIKSVEVIR